MKKRILITGARGVLGKELMKSLNQKYDVYGIDIAPCDNENISQVDIRHYGDVYRALDGIDYVIHAASLHGIDLNSRSRLDFIESNVVGTANLLEASSFYKIEKFIYISSTSVYGSSKDNRSNAAWYVHEELPVNPADIYDLTKLQGEELCKHYTKSYGLPTLIFRAAKFYEGPDPVENYVQRLYKGTDVRDLVQAIELGLEKSELKADIFNIAAQTPFQYEDVQDLMSHPEKVIWNLFPEMKKIFEDNSWKIPNSIKKVYCIDKAVKELGYKPNHNFEEILQLINKKQGALK
ncbi:NAD-dependent epimerase/dehydratase family protein [Bacillus cereus]|uniref:NAD-dependent epimerase/dehydratase family protein n=1 Tax=Bacillus cereus TaxID=1396 RepID=UPI000B4B50CD|nr:NAD(P)-dependent oxidoreductase [Bacillus cereus]WJX08080.1 NAD(P)-dependent oxidoreductase [Bacillus cereus]